MLGILPVPFTAIYVFVTNYLSNPLPDLQDRVLEVLRDTTRHTIQWRQNAIRINNKDGEDSAFEYRQEGDRMIRYRCLLFSNHLDMNFVFVGKAKLQLESLMELSMEEWFLQSKVLCTRYLITFVLYQG